MEIRNLRCKSRRQVWRSVVSVLALGMLAVPPVSAQTPAVTIEYYHVDAVGSVRAVTNASGAVIRRHDYRAFGEGENPSAGADPVRFTGKERDRETGLDYFGARYYASPAGRFTTVDPAMDIEVALTDPQRWNRYAYSLNNPLRYTDPDGRSPKLAILALKVGHALYKGYDVYSTVKGVVDAGGTVISGDATTGARAWAGLQLAGELSGVTDLFKAGRGVLNAIDASRAYKYTHSELIDEIRENGLRRIEGRNVFATPTGDLSSLGAQIELALPGNRMRNAVVKIDLEGLRKAGYKVPAPTRVTGQFGRPGGGWQYEFDYDIPAEFLIWK